MMKKLNAACLTGENNIEISLVTFFQCLKHIFSAQDGHKEKIKTLLEPPFNKVSQGFKKIAYESRWSVYDKTGCAR
jgi:hypothetical protein